MRHPLTLLTREVRPLDLRVENTCLLMQDLHAPFADPVEGWLARRAREKVLLPEFRDYFEMLALVAANLPRLLAAARSLGIPVVYSCLGYRAPGSPSAFQEATGWTWDLAGPDGRIPAEWRPAHGEPVFTKPGWGALSGDGLAAYLQDRAIANVILVGTMLEFGIAQTCGELSDRGLGTLVVSDAVVPLTTTGGRFASGSLAHGLTKLRSTAELLGLLETLARDGAVLI